MSYDSKFKSEECDRLFEAILSLEDSEDCYRYFEDLMTVKELKSLSQRWEVARLLDEGKTYTEIEKLTSASAATISRVNKCLAYGADGYRRVLEKLKRQA